MSTDQQPDEPIPDEAKAEPDQPPVTEFDISALYHEETEEEKASEQQRWKMISQGRHPDTGKRLRHGDEKTLRSAAERMRVQTYLAAQVADRLNLIPPDVRATMEAQAQPLRAVAQQAIDRLGINHYAIGARSVIDDLSLSSARALADQTRAELLLATDRAALHSLRPYIDPINDPNLITRLVDRVDPGLLHRATALAEPYAMQAIREQVNAAAVHRITDAWLDTNSISMARASVAGFVSDQTLMANTAARMLDIYGAGIAEQPRFLREFLANISLFRPELALSEAAFQRSDLLARLTLPQAAILGFEDYSHENVERVRQYGESALTELGSDFGRDHNPVHAWDAYRVARTYGLDVPDWVFEYMDDAADALLSIRDAVAKKEPPGREADQAGKAIGFKASTGRGGYFADAVQLQSDREIYFEIIEWLEREAERLNGRKPKLSSAYDAVASNRAVDPATIRRAWRRIKDLIGDDPEPDEE